MKIVKIVSFICVLALALTLVSSFAFAAAPEAGDSSRASDRCYVKTATYLYKDTTGSTYHRLLSVGQELIILQGGNTATWRHVSMPSGSPSGYVLRSHIIEPG